MLNVLLLASGIALYVWLVLILWRRRVYRNFPVFFSYNIYAVVGSTARLLASSDVYLYFYVFWWTDLGFLLFGIASIHKAFRSVFEGFYLLRWFRWLYFGAIGTIVAASILNSVFNRPVEVFPFLRIVLDIETPIYCVQAAIFGLFYLCVKLLNVGFRRYPFAIVLGFGIQAMGTLLPFVARSIFGKKAEIFVAYTHVVAYYMTLAVWLSAFLGTDRGQDEQAPPMSSEQMADQVRQYTRIVKGFFGRSNAS